MNRVGTILDELLKLARKDDKVLHKILDTQRAEDPVGAFCEYARSLGYELYEIDLADAEEEWSEQKLKGINGGGANHMIRDGMDDFYSQFISAIK